MATEKPDRAKTKKDSYVDTARNEIVQWESQGPGFLAQVGDFVLWPAQKAAEILIPDGVQKAVGKAIEAFLSGLGRTSRVLISEDEIRNRIKDHRQKIQHPLEASDEAAKHYWNWHLGYAFAEGGATGAAGFVGLAADIPALFTISLRLIQQIAICYGYDVSKDTEHAYVLQVLRTGSTANIKAKMEFLVGLKEVEQILLQVSWKKMNEALAQKQLSQMAGIAAVRQFAQGLGIQLTKRKALQLVPIIGALVGASFNTAFANDVGRAAFMSYRRRWISDSTGPSTMA